jgi:hypothetical protein
VPKASPQVTITSPATVLPRLWLATASIVVGSGGSSPASLREGEREYYEKQLATLRTFDEVEALCMPDEFDSDLEAFEDKEQKQSESAMKISIYANTVLLVFKVSSCFSLHSCRMEFGNGAC